jgi:hypothetical protein
MFNLFIIDRLTQALAWRIAPSIFPFMPVDKGDEALLGDPALAAW